MDPDDQQEIVRVVDAHGPENVVVVLGAADVEALEVAAETVTEGDPAYVGPLAGVQLGLQVVHIFEDDVKEEIEPAVYEEQIGFLELSLDADAVRRAMADRRKRPT
jgi:glycine/sarcosine/betaine reductase complex component A